MFNLGNPKFRVKSWNYDYAPNPAMLRLKLEREGYRVFQWGDSPGAVFPPHKHTAEKSHWVVSGALELTINGEVYVLEAGDRDFIEAETYYSMRVVSEESVIYLVGEKIEK